ncbi:MAG: O-antigen ligase family protein [Candidatus Omnitrophica bacterium]|nr:O-antigen ligase family protein [Candidatus Omnitrophota bacterium]
MKNGIRKTEVNPRIYERAALFIFLFAGPLIRFTPAYDYTLIKNIAGYLFCILLSALFIIKKKGFAFEIKNLAVFMVFAAWILLSSFTAPFGYGAARSLEDYILYFLVFICASNMDFNKKDVYIWVAAGIIASFTAIFNFIGPRKYVVSTFGNPNFFAGHIMMLIALASAMLFSKDIKKNERLFLAVFIISAFFGILATKSRAAISGTLFGTATLLFLVNIKGTFIKKWSPYMAILAAGALSYGYAYRWITTNIRWYIWNAALEMVKVKPLAGWGLGNFTFFYPYYRIREYFLQPEATPVTIHTHNEYLQILSETGIIGLILFLAFIVIIIENAVRNSAVHPQLNPLPAGTNPSRERDMQTGSLLIKGCISGIAAVLADNIFSTNLRNPSTAMYFWFLLGLAAGHVKKHEIDFKLSRLLWYTAGAVGFIMCVFTSFYRISPEIYLKRGIWAKEAGDLRTAVDNYLVVCSMNPNNHEAWYKLAFAYGESGKLEEAKEIYLKINKYIFPHFAKTDANTGTIYLREGNFEKAFYYYKWAEWLNPYDKDVLCTIASIQLMFYNNVPEAVSYLNRVLTIDPENGYANRIINLLKAEGKI